MSRPEILIVVVFIFSLCIRLVYLNQLISTPIFQGLAADSEKYESFALQILGGDFTHRDFLYLNPNLVNRDIIAKDFSEPVRIYPIMFEEQKTDIDQVTIELPPGHQVTSLPAPIHLEEDFGEFQAEYRIENGSVSYKRTFTINELIVPATSYEAIKSFFNQIFEQDQKVITIKRTG